MAARRSKFNALKKDRVLQALRKGTRRGQAAEKAGITRQTLAAAIRKDATFAAAVDQAELDAHELVEDALFRQAVKGNTTAIQVWLYNRLPDRWRDRRNLNQKPLEAFLASLPPELAAAIGPLLGIQPISPSITPTSPAGPGG